MKKYKIVIDKNSNYLEAFKYTFKDNIFEIDNNNDIKTIETIAKELENIDNVIFFNLNDDNNLLLNILPNSVNKYIIFEYSISEFSDPKKFNQVLLSLKYLDNKFIKDTYCLNYAMYSIFKDKYKFKYLQLDIGEYNNKVQPSNSIGIIGEPNDYYSCVMNVLSSITLTDFNEVKLLNPVKPVEKFAKRFKIKVNKLENLHYVIDNNEINIYINFAGTSYPLILESLNKKIPCIVGNTDLFDSNPILKKYLVMKSDDDINELRDRINNVKKHKKEIIKEYEKFHKIYTKECKKNIEEFINNLK